MLRRKLDFLTELGERIHTLYGRGLKEDEITWTGGDFSKSNFVRAFLRPRPPAGV
jgi:hypothetical protein